VANQALLEVKEAAHVKCASGLVFVMGKRKRKAAQTKRGKLVSAAGLVKMSSAVGVALAVYRLGNCYL